MFESEFKLFVWCHANCIKIMFPGKDVYSDTPVHLYAHLKRDTGELVEILTDRCTDVYALKRLAWIILLSIELKLKFADPSGTLVEPKVEIWSLLGRNLSAKYVLRGMPPPSTSNVTGVSISRIFYVNSVTLHSVPVTAWITT